MHQPVTKYYSNIAVFLKPIAILFLIIAIGGSLYYGQEYWVSGNLNEQLADFLFNCVLIFAILMGIFYILKMVYPISIKQDSIRCYDSAGKYHTVQWSDIIAAYPKSVVGFKYIFVEAKGLTSPLTIPLFIDNKESFVATLRTKDKKGVIIPHFM